MASDANFINRSEELDFLRDLVPPRCQASSMLIIRAPSGFGKSSLTDRLFAEVSASEVNAAIVDPSIRLRSGDAKIYDGYFVQKCAADLAGRAERNDGVGFGSFLASRRWITASEKDHSDILRKYPSPSTMYAALVDYVERLFGTGTFSEQKILASDAKFAVQICREYVKEIATRGPLVCIIREAQHIDHESLRFFLTINKTVPQQHLILEYTSFNGRFDPDHEKVFLRELESHSNAHILDLMRLDREHLLELLRANFGNSAELHSEYYLQWDGNLRAVSEMRYRVGLARRLDQPETITKSLASFGNQIREHLQSLAPLQKLILAVASANIEALDRHTMVVVVGRLDLHSTISERDRSLSELITVHRFLESTGSGIRLHDEDVAKAVSDDPSFTVLLVLAQKSLRNYYRELIEKQQFANVAAAVAIRQTLRLCAATKDAVGVLEVSQRLTEIIRASNDQGLYVDAVGDALENGNFLHDEERTLVNWASAITYEISDFSRTAAILKRVPIDQLDPYQGLMLACAQQEIGEQTDALRIVSTMRMSSKDIQLQLGCDIVEFLVQRAWGQYDAARERLKFILTNSDYEGHPFIGYALRISESITEFPAATANLKRSVEIFASVGLRRSQAYSALAAAMHLAREGNTSESIRMLDDATAILDGEIRDQHLLLNDRSVIDLLSANPNFEKCARDLLLAMQTSRDDFSDVTILNNLAIAFAKLGRLDDAVDCVDRLMVIIDEPNFGDREIFWGLAFNAMEIYRIAGREARSEEMRNLPQQTGVSPLLYTSYWEERFGREGKPDPKFQFLLRFDYHPLFLSHWLIDLEGLELLKRGSPRSLPHTTSHDS